MGMGTAAIAAVACLHAAGLYWALIHTSNVIKIPEQQPSTITFELSAPPQPKVEAPGPVVSQPPAVQPEQKPVAPEPPPRPAEPKKKPAEKKPVEKPKPVKAAPNPKNEVNTSTPVAPSSQTSSATEDKRGAPSTATPAGTGGQQMAAVPAQVGRFQTNNPSPKYPMQARRRHMEGLVILTVRVSEDGRVVDARVKNSSGYDLLDDSALETVRLWRFEPGHQGGNATASWTDVRINFRLD